MGFPSVVVCEYISRKIGKTTGVRKTENRTDIKQSNNGSREREKEEEIRDGRAQRRSRGISHRPGCVPERALRDGQHNSDVCRRTPDLRCEGLSVHDHKGETKGI
jgi:hypothetical protein